MQKAIIAIALAAILSSGCKIRLIAPEGADIVSSSGAFDCRAGSSCTLDIDHPYFYEAFTVSPLPGYEFVRFKSGQGRLCMPNKKPVCGRLSTRGFPANEALSDLLAGDSLFFLEPEVRPDGTVPVADSDSLNVTLRETVRLEHYTITGTTVNSVRASLYSEDNPFFTAEPVGSGIQVGATVPGYNYSFTAERTRQGSSECRFTRLTIDAEITLVMPGLEDRHTLPTALQEKWDRFYSALLVHEGGHANFARDSFAQIIAFFKTRGVFACDEISDEIATALEQAAAGYEERSFNYDVQTNHGVFEGVSF